MFGISQYTVNIPGSLVSSHHLQESETTDPLHTQLQPQPVIHIKDYHHGIIDVNKKKSSVAQIL